MSEEFEGPDSAGASFRAGVRDISPIMVGIFPFALVAGVAQISAGLDPFTAISVSFIIFAGAAQLATAELLSRDAPAVIICMTALIINLRFVMYSASLSTHFRQISSFRKWLSAYLITDQAYAISIIRFSRKIRKGQKFWFYLGSALPLWILWQIGTSVGVVLGLKIPASWSLDFAVPLTFMAILLPNLRDVASVVAALVSGVVAVAALNLPLNISIIVAVVSGIMAGFCLESIMNRKTGK